MQLESLKNSLFQMSAAESAAIVGGETGTFTHGTTFYANGKKSIDSYETD